MEAISSQVEQKPATQVDFDGSLVHRAASGAWDGASADCPILETRGPAASMLRDSLFRRLLLAGDVLAIVGAFALAIELSGGRLHLAGSASPACR